MKDLIYEIDSALVYLKDSGFSVSIIESKTENDLIRVSIRKRSFDLKDIWDDVLTVSDLLKSKWSDVNYKKLTKRYICDNVECDTSRLERNMSIENRNSIDVRETFVILYKLAPDFSRKIDLNFSSKKHIESYSLFESKSSIKFIKKEKKKGAKTDTYDVSKGGTIIGQIKWSSRMRGYAFLPTSECDSDVKDFIKELMRKRREDK